MAELRDFLSEEQVKQLEEAGFQVQPKGDYIPKARFDEINTRMKDAETKNAEYVKQLEELNSSKGDAEALKKKIEELSAQASKDQADFETKVAAIKREALINTELIKAGARNTAAIWATTDLSQVVMNGDKLENIEEAIKKSKETDSYLWLTEEKQTFRAGNPVGKEQAPDEMEALTKLL